MVHCENRYFISTSEGPGSVSYVQNLDQTLGKFLLMYEPHLTCTIEVEF